MINTLVGFALKQRVVVIFAFGAMCLVGALAFMRLNIEAYPDPLPTMVNVITLGTGLSAEDIERYITIPIETATGATSGLRLTHSTSVFGLSNVKLHFGYDIPYEVALQRVLIQLALVPPLPGGVQPQISPLNPFGEIFRYRLVGPPDYSQVDLKTLQTWVVQRRLRTVPGVGDVISWGGLNKNYQVSIDPLKLLAYGLTLPQVMTALQNANQNVGGNTMSIGPQAGVVRGVGLISTVDDLRTPSSPPSASPPCACATSPTSRSATSRASALPARTTMTTTCRASSSCCGASRACPPSSGCGPRWSACRPAACCRPACASSASTTARS